MSELYNTIEELCKSEGITAYRLCKDIGIRPSVVTDLKMGRKQTVNAETAIKIANYFGITADDLMSGAQKKPDAKCAELSDDERCLLDINSQLSPEQQHQLEEFARFLLHNQ